MKARAATVVLWVLVLRSERVLGHSHMGTPGLSTPAFQENTAGNVPNYCWSETQHGFGISCQCSSVVQHRYSREPTEKQHHFL